MMRCIYCYPHPDLIVHETQNLCVVVDPFPICVGHVLVLSKKHYGCIGELSLNEIKELQDLSDVLIQYTKEQFGHFISFEHGRAGICATSHDTLCVHMHLHILPAQIDITKDLSDQYFPLKIEKLDNIPKQFHGFGEYIFYHNQHNRFCFLLNSKPIPPHYLRTLITNAREEPHLSDWDKYQAPEIINQNMQYKIQLKRRLEGYISR